MIVVGGEALVDLVPGPDGALHPHPGGGPFNVARTIGRLEQPVAFLGRLSRDSFGEQHVSQLAEDSVSLECVQRTDEPSTLALVELDAAGVATYRFYTKGTAAAGLAAAVLPPGAEALHVGTLGLALEPVGAALETAVAGAGGDTLVMVDPNHRPGAAPDEAAYRERLRRVVARADVVKVSDDDLRSLDLDPHGLAPLVLLTRGGEGAIALTREGEVEVPAPPVDVVDTIGAGDAFGGAFLAWWRAYGLGRRELRDRASVWAATEFACLVAARTCERAGASPPRLAELGLSGWPASGA